MGRNLKKNETILVVGNKDNASKYLAKEQGLMQGFNTIFACCAEEALQIASNSPKIDMLLTDPLLDDDAYMSGINGIQFAQEFARKYPKTKIVFMIP